MGKKTLLIATTLGLAVVLFFSAAAWAGERVGPIEVNIQPVPSKDTQSGGITGTSHGYVEFRVQLKNSLTKDLTVSLSYPGTGDKRTVSYGVVVSREVRVGGGQEASVSLFQPPGGMPMEAMEVQVEGVRDSKVIPAPSLHSWHDYSSAPDRTVVLLSRSVPQEFYDLVHATGTPMPGSSAPPPTLGRSPTGRRAAIAMPPGPGGPDRFSLLRSELPLGQWSPNWLGYSCYDVIVLTEKEAAEMPSQVQLAIRRYLECGGSLLVHGKKVPVAFSQGGIADDEGGYIVGLGHAAASFDGDESDWKATCKKLMDSPAHVYQPIKRPGGRHDLLVAEATVPVRGLFVLVLVFGIGIGPANLWLLSRYKRRIWLWWNVPLISLATCLAVFGYSLVSEGITGRGKIASITLLDERCHRATTFGYLSFYCPLTPSEGPHFGVDTDVALLGDNAFDRRRGYPVGIEESLRLVDWTNDQHLTSGWVNARVPAYFQIRKNEDHRERVSVEKDADGSLKITNALGEDIRLLYLADAAGHVFEGRDIRAGAKQTLTARKTTLAPEGGQMLLRNMFVSSDLLGGIQSWKQSLAPDAMLSPGCYLAYLDKSPFVESPLKGVESEDTAAIVYGILKEPIDGR